MRTFPFHSDVIRGLVGSSDETVSKHFIDLQDKVFRKELSYVD